ncbi:hypothetical protein L210DRAFT_3486005 [Boletus edulis BED1]|uniref:G domain-containing protein n=1 Tax=Boletus edulis BED1 TaxID=1328754 RepID=A0AAD4BLE7_BOLED|nr:hypothetical protein L210DRAFT_3486005 [Boletus edulis BED1]
MSINDPASQSTLDSTLYASAIDISLAKDSHKTIESIKVKKNSESVKDVLNPMYVNGVYRMEFSPLLVIDPEEHISVSINCSWLASATRVAEDIPIDINLRDIECTYHGQGITSYRKKERDVEVVITGHHSLLATTTLIIQSCERFRLLIIGNSGVGKSSLLYKVFGVAGVHTSQTARGAANINQEFIATTNDRFVVHDSLGFESGDDRNMGIVKDFVSRRKAMPQLKDQLHTVWLCLETPYAGGRLLEGGAEDFLRRRTEVLGKIPLVVVLTKADQLDIQLMIDPPEDDDVEQYKSRYLDKHCVEPLHKAAGSDVTHVAVSAQDGYSESLSNLVRATDKTMAKYHVDEAPRVVASIAQRVSIKDKIELSIAIGEKRYWNMLFDSGVFRGHTLQEYLQVIRKDIVTIWNFDDPGQYLMDDNIIKALLHTDNLVGEGTSEAPSSMDSFANFLVSALKRQGSLSGSGGIMLSDTGATAGVASSVARTMYEAYQAEEDVKTLVTYVVDLICVMQAIFLLASGGRDAITAYTVTLVLQAYEETKKIVHMSVDGFDGKPGVLAGGRDHVLDGMEKLIWHHSIADRDIEGLRRRIDLEALPSGSL